MKIHSCFPIVIFRQFVSSFGWECGQNTLRQSVTAIYFLSKESIASCRCWSHIFGICIFRPSWVIIQGVHSVENKKKLKLYLWFACPVYILYTSKPIICAGLCVLILNNYIKMKNHLPLQVSTHDWWYSLNSSQVTAGLGCLLLPVSKYTLNTWRLLWTFMFVWIERPSNLNELEAWKI